MATLIVHPAFEVQKTNALLLAGKYLRMPISLEAIPTDLHLIDGTLVTSIGIDDVRELIRRLQYHPYEAAHQVGLILMANMLTEEAQNSLLKNLEEPSSQTEFILTTPHEKFLLPTILSRCQTLFVQEKISVSDTAASTSKQEDANNTQKFLALTLVDKFVAIDKLLAEDKEQPGVIMAFLANLVDHYRTLLLSTTAAGDTAGAVQNSTDIKRINRAVHFMNKNANKRLTLENLILQLEKRIIKSRSPRD